MKKILLSAMMLSSLAAFAQNQRMVLIEEFTQASCGPCASQNPAFNTLLANNMSKVAQIKYQTSWPGTDPMNTQNPTDVATRVTRYGVNGVPFGVMDGDTNAFLGASYAGAPANATQAKIDTRWAVTSPLLVNATYAFNSTTNTITSTVTITNNSAAAITPGAANSLKLHFALVEMNINFATAPGSNGEKDFFYVMRKMYPSAAGTTLANGIAAGQTLTFTFTEIAPTYIYKKEQMAVVAFVQDENNNVVYQTAIGRPAGCIDIKNADNSVVTQTNYCAASIAPSITVTNKGTVAITSGTAGYTVNGAGGTSQPWTGNLAAGASTTITMPNITVPMGSNIYKFYFNNVNNGAVDIMESDNIMASRVASVVGTITGTFTEDFESTAVGTFYTSKSINTLLSRPSYVVDKTINSTITNKLGGYGLSNNSFRFNFYNMQTGRPKLAFYKYTFNGTGIKSMVFDWAYNHYIENGTSYYDSMAVMVSTDCGASWSQIFAMDGESMRTTAATPTTASFYPKDAEWRTVSVELPDNVKNGTDVLVAFEGRTGWGNNLYIDNVRYTTTVGVETVKNLGTIRMYPNPASDIINIDADLSDNAPATLTVTDMAGKVLFTKTFTNTSTLEERINTSAFANGLYNVTLKQNGKVTSHKMTVAH